MDDIQNFRQNISNLFSAATGLNCEEANKVLFENQKFNLFDELLGEGKLDLVKTQIQFFETSIAVDDVSDIKDILLAMAQETKQMIFDFAIKSFDQKKIPAKEFETRSKAFIGNLSNKDFKKQVKENTEKALGYELYIEL